MQSLEDTMARYNHVMWKKRWKRKRLYLGPEACIWHVRRRVGKVWSRRRHMQRMCLSHQELTKLLGKTLKCEKVLKKKNSPPIPSSSFNKPSATILIGEFRSSDAGLPQFYTKKACRKTFQYFQLLKIIYWSSQIQQVQVRPTPTLLKS